MIRELRISIMVLLVLSCLTGMIYPVTVTVMAHLLFPDQSNGSLIMIKDRVVGSRLIGQSFTSPKYFWGRLSATSPVPYNAAASGGSNYGPMHPDLMKAAETRIGNLLNGGPRSSLIPVDLVTASGSGLDPHISIAAANFQVTRIARARNISVEFVQRLIRQHTEGRQFGLLGEPRVNVLNLNLALDRLRNQE